MLCHLSLSLGRSRTFAHHGLDAVMGSTPAGGEGRSGDLAIVAGCLGVDRPRGGQSEIV
jgi:hypothetical protein